MKNNFQEFVLSPFQTVNQNLQTENIPSGENNVIISWDFHFEIQKDVEVHY